MTLSEIRNTTQSARGYLRAATADLHAELDARLAPMVRQGDVSYTRFLLCSAMALLPIERSLEETNVAAVLPDWSQRRRSHTLRLDLAEMSLPEPPSLPAPEVLGNAFQFGMLYVLEGSRLGNSTLGSSGAGWIILRRRSGQINLLTMGIRCGRRRKKDKIRTRG
jgi:heme oxygenase